MKLPFAKLFGKGRASDDDAESDAGEAIDTGDAVSDAGDAAKNDSPAEAAAESDTESDTDTADSLPEDEDGEGRPGRGAALFKDWRVLAGGGLGLALLLVAGGGWWWMNGEPEAPSKPLPRLNIEIPARASPPRAGLLTPPTEAQPTATAAAPARETPPAEPAAAPAGPKEPQVAAAPPPAATEPKPAPVATPAPAPAPVPVAAPPPRPATGESRVASWVLPAAFAAVPAAPPVQALSIAPEPGLVEAGDDGVLPKIGADGREPRRAYARAFPAADARPRIAIIVTGLGLSRAATEAAIAKLPPAVTLAFDPHAKDLASWVVPARQGGHETLMALPMEPHNFPIVDPGPYALWSTVDAANNLRRLEFVLSRMPGYVGVVSQLGSAFTIQDEAMKPVLEALKKRGLLYVDARSVSQTRGPKLAADLGLGRAVVDLVLDAEPARAELDAKLAQLETLAREKSVAVATAHAYPLTVARLAQWAAGLEAKRLVLAPVSAIADKQPLP